MYIEGLKNLKIKSMIFKAMETKLVTTHRHEFNNSVLIQQIYLYSAGDIIYAQPLLHPSSDNQSVLMVIVDIDSE